jgi:hypothetical protein
MSVDQFLLSADTTDLNYPEIRPTLDLNFARTKTLDPRIDFTRASGGSYVGADGLIKYAGVNEARFDHDPLTGESLGLLIEEARTNIKIRSEELNLDFSSARIASILQNEVISPDGLKTADGIVPNNTFDAHYLDKVFTSASGITASQNICCSAFFKKGVGREVWLQIYEQSGNAYHGVQFNFETETLTFRSSNEYITGGGVTVGYGVIKYPNGWYRLWVAGYPNTTTTGRRYRIRLTDASGAFDFSGDVVSSYLYAWGVQVEVGSFPTSYIPTQGSTRTRALDNVSITGKNFSEWYSQGTSGSIYCNFRTFSREYSTQTPFRIHYGSNLRGIGSNVDTRSGVNKPNFVARTDGGISGVNNDDVTYGLNTNFKVAGAYGINEIAAAFNGNIKTSPQSFVFIPMTRMDIATRNPVTGSLNSYNGYISRLTYFPKRLPNSQLISLTL